MRDEFFIGFVMNDAGTITCNVNWPDHRPPETIAPAIAAMIVQLKDGGLADLCLETIASEATSVDDAMLNATILAHMNNMSGNNSKENAVVDPSDVFRFRRIDEDDGQP
jgi:hypothetical protein